MTVFGKRLLSVFVALIAIFEILPLLVIIPTSFGAREGVEFPPSNLTLKWYIALFNDSQWIDATFNSVKIGFLATLVALAMGIPAAYSLARFRFPGRPIVETLLVCPLIYPAVMYGLATMLFLTSLGLRGSLIGVVMVNGLATLPYVVRVLGAAFASPEILTAETAARSLGAGPVRAFATVTLPLVRSAMVAGMLFSFIMSFTDFDRNVFVVSPQDMTLPILIFQKLTYVYSPLVLAASTLLILISSLVILVLDRVFQIEKYFRA